MKTKKVIKTPGEQKEKFPHLFKEPFFSKEYEFKNDCYIIMYELRVIRENLKFIEDYLNKLSICSSFSGINSLEIEEKRSKANKLVLLWGFAAEDLYVCTEMIEETKEFISVFSELGADCIKKVENSRFLIKTENLWNIEVEFKINSQRVLKKSPLSFILYN